ncbi:type VI secretion system-associated protein TagF [Massilia sp. G4R7]|uniref:Type VI secretion system-associated protein TagF n=1 Tax=Massilia phyllostachyos TaxID=2898585 RepID=A0ABS8Q874_9BURK|nr:type VI secretion system-associated protein TagF [Massilia phyllostachyos]
MTGYYGKVSTHGDFVGRGLPAQLVQAWDGWLQEGMRASRNKLGAAWLERYLHAPVWRFAIAPGVLGPEGLGGVMMPSVDRVGRYFPLMLGAVGAPPLLDWFHGQAAWYDALEDLARESLDPAFALERLDGAPQALLAASPPFSVRIPLGEGVRAVMAAASLRGHTLWWTEGGPFVEASMLLCSGMPQEQAFTAMLDGDWTTLS